MTNLLRSESEQACPTLAHGWTQSENNPTKSNYLLGDGAPERIGLTEVSQLLNLSNIAKVAVEFIMGIRLLSDLTTVHLL